MGVFIVVGLIDSVMILVVFVDDFDGLSFWWCFIYLLELFGIMD